MTREYFLKLQSTDNCLDKIRTEINTRTDWQIHHGFPLIRINSDLFRDSFIHKVIKDFMGVPIVLKMEPMTWYDWHVDDKRKCAINRLITGYDSKTFYGNHLSDNILGLTELKYNPENYYLLNTQSSHAVLNLSEPRYVLSIGFSNFDYAFISKYLEDNNI